MADALTLGENVAKAAARVRSYTDAISLGENLAKSVGIARALVDAMSLSDVVATALVLRRSLTDPIALGENLLRAAFFARLYQDPLTLGENVTKAVPTAGFISREVWTGVSGTAVVDIPVGTTPNITDTLSSFEAPIDWADNYGTRVRGYITAPATGSYTFWIASDDASELWLSTNNDPANKVKIGWVLTDTSSRQWNKFASQKSAAITLTQGQQYYVEALQKEGAGGDNLAVGWAKPGESTSAPSEVIPGSVLSPFLAMPTRSVTDPISLGENVLRVALFSRFYQDALTLGEAISRIAAFSRSITDPLSLGENLSKAMSFRRSLTDALALAENLTKQLVLSRSLTDALSLSEVLSKVLLLSRQLSDPLILSEALLKAFGLSRQFSNALLLGEFIDKIIIAGGPAFRTAWARRPYNIGTGILSCH